MLFIYLLDATFEDGQVSVRHVLLIDHGVEGKPVVFEAVGGEVFTASGVLKESIGLVTLQTTDPALRKLYA